MERYGIEISVVYDEDDEICFCGGIIKEEEQPNGDILFVCNKCSFVSGKALKEALDKLEIK
ncbi:MAG: hypothetical protein WC511_01875 [Candidatus Pacearchaeota archaeon]